MLASCLAMLGFIATAEAHFKLNAPAALTQQDADGNPQKSPPCGGNPGTPTNMVTAVQSGSMLQISITETIYHPGHYRVALAQDTAGLPPVPNVTDNNCNGLAPVANPTLPVLADGLLAHTAPFNPTTQTMQVPIPAGMTCNNCVHLVVQYMAQQGQPCFYSHCAKVNIAPTAPPPPDGGIDPGGDGGTDQPGPADPGGGCSTSRGAATGLLGGLAVALMMLRRRRRR
jgi:hypothetical protein